MNELELTRETVKILDRKKAMDIKVLRINELSIVADYFVIASGTSNTHVKSLADEVEYELSQKGIEPSHIEGRATGWILLDYNDVLVHVFQPESRQYYNIERLWNDAARVDLSDVLTED